MSSARTLVFLLNSGTNQILLGLKKKGFGAGKIVGIGGKVEVGETIAAAALREVQEEIGVLIEQKELSAKGVLRFRFPTKPSWNQDVHVFTVSKWQGQPRESEEIQPIWTSTLEVPYQKMWDDARYWLPKLLQGQSVSAMITFAEDLETVQSVSWE